MWLVCLSVSVCVCLCLCLFLCVSLCVFVALLLREAASSGCMWAPCGAYGLFFCSLPWVHFTVCLSFCLFLCLSVCISVCLVACPSGLLPVCGFSVYMPACLFGLPVCLALGRQTAPLQQRLAQEDKTACEHTWNVLDIADLRRWKPEISVCVFVFISVCMCLQYTLTFVCVSLLFALFYVLVLFSEVDIKDKQVGLFINTCK